LPRKRPKTGRLPGRPYAGRALYERIHWVDWVETYAEEYKQAGSKKPYLQILLDLLEMTGGHLTTEEIIAVTEVETVADRDARAAEIIADERRFAGISKRFKKRRHKARRELQTIEETARKRAAQTNRRPEEAAEPFEKEDLRARRPHRPKYARE
jgi:hypothetical protein